VWEMFDVGNPAQNEEHPWPSKLLTAPEHSAAARVRSGETTRF
jgi:hypothetical protein